jgi:hypothetical protein
VLLVDSFTIDLCFGGECLQTRQEMLNEYNKAITRLIRNPNTDPNLGPWIERCWYYWDPRYPNGELNDKLGETILSVLKNKDIKENVKIKCLEIACNAAPQNLFPEMIRILKDSEGIRQELAFRAILEIWKYNANNNPKIAGYDYIKLFKNTIPDASSPPFKDKVYIYNYGKGQRPITQQDYWLCSLYSAMGQVYPYDYLKIKKILIDSNLFFPSNCTFGKIFQDPRAFEDADYRHHDFESNLFFSLLNHLELEFKIEWLNKIKKHQLRLLRNGIMASYGWEFKDPKLKAWFDTYLAATCRNGVCGRVNDRFNKNLITDIDERNIALIKSLE